MNVKFKIWCIIRMVTIWQKYWHDGQIKIATTKRSDRSTNFGIHHFAGAVFYDTRSGFVRDRSTVIHDDLCHNFWRMYNKTCLDIPPVTNVTFFCENRTLPEASLTRTRTHLVPTFWPSYHLQRTRCGVWSLFTFFAQSSLPIVTFAINLIPC